MTRLVCSRQELPHASNSHTGLRNTSSTYFDVLKRSREQEHLSGAQQPSANEGDFAFGVAASAGRRPYMEDRHSVVTADSVRSSVPGLNFFLVADGHGGASVAEHLSGHLYKNLVSELGSWEESDATKAERALSAAYVSIDKNLPDSCGSECGSTALTALVSKTHVTVANTGDSRAILSKGGIAVALSQDHSPERTDEQDRVREAGGLILNHNGIRVMGVLAMTRAIGDKCLRQYGVIPDPDVISVPISSEDDFLILASDGLWDVMTNQEAVDTARLCKHKASVRGADHGVASRVAARVLMRTALQRGSRDNITVIVVDLTRPQLEGNLHQQLTPPRPCVISGYQPGQSFNSCSKSLCHYQSEGHGCGSLRVVSSGMWSEEQVCSPSNDAKRMRITFQPKAAAGRQQKNLQKLITTFKPWHEPQKGIAKAISA